jgi:hypothetical protein
VKHDVVPVDVISTATETYNLEVSMDSGPHPGALEKALSAGMLAYEQQVISRIIKILEATEVELNAESQEDAAAGVAFAANRVRNLLPQQASPPYNPHQDDLVEIVLCGRVHIAEDTCESCGAANESMWSLYDFRTGAEYYFDQAELQRNLDVRMVSRAEEDD